MKLRILGNNRSKALYISGESGSGKSSLIQHMVLQDIRNGHGVCIIAPDRDLIAKIIEWIPENRVKDTIYFDADEPLRIDMFSYSTPQDRRILTDQLVNLFDLETAPISRPRLRRIIGTLFDANDALKKMGNPERYTFLDIKTFIEDEDVQKQIFKIVPSRRKEWEHFPKMSDFTPILERLTPFTEAPNLKTMFSGGGLNIWEVLEKGQILLVNLRDTSTDLFLGSLIVAKIQQAIFARDPTPESQRIPYYLYVDECDTIMEFCAREFATLLTRARKYKLCLTMANVAASFLPKNIQKRVPLIYNEIRILFPYKAYLRTGREYTDFHTPKHLGTSPASYAELITKRPVDSSPCISTQVRHDVSNAYSYEKPEVEPTEPISLPPDQNKNRRA